LNSYLKLSFLCNAVIWNSVFIEKKQIKRNRRASCGVSVLLAMEVSGYWQAQWKVVLSVYGAVPEKFDINGLKFQKNNSYKTARQGKMI